MKEINITVPEGYEIDKENSTFECIKFKKRIEVDTWEDIESVEGFYISNTSGISHVNTDVNKNNSWDKNIFIDMRHVKSALAMAQISQLMPYYGGAITNAEWDDFDLTKYVITRCGNDSETGAAHSYYEFLAFHTEEQRDRFLSFPENVQLVKDYLMID